LITPYIICPNRQQSENLFRKAPPPASTPHPKRDSQKKCRMLALLCTHGLNHLPVEIVTLTGALADTSEYRETTCINEQGTRLQGNVIPTKVSL
jgi:hypothetical protein